MAFRSDTGIQTDGLSWFFGRKGGTGVAGWMCFLGEKKTNTIGPDFGCKKIQQGQPFWLCVFIHLDGSMNVFQLLFRKKN